MPTVPKKKLGKRPAVVDTTVPHFSLIQPQLIKPPPSINWYAAVGDWEMFGNDTLGDCVPAAIFHAVKQFTTYAGRSFNATDQEVIAAYQTQGYVPGDPNTDNGSLVLGPTGMLPYWHTNGFTMAGQLHKVSAFLQLANPNPDHWRQGIFTFGGVMVGFNLPEYIMAPAETPYVWDVQPGGGNPAIAGGHEVWMDGYLTVAGEELFEFVSWGERFRMTTAFMLKYVDEVAVLYDRASLNSHGVDARGLPDSTLTALMAGLRNIA